MTDQIHLEREWYSISETQFGFLYPEQIKKISCCEVTSTQVYDANKNPIKNGLYDPAMGVSPNERETVCVTCGHYGMKCSGHPGHIELVLPVYNPMIIDVLLKLLRMNCFNCHRFRIKQRIKQQCEVAMVLMKNGLVNQAKTYFQIDPQSEKRRLAKLQREKPKEKDDDSVKQLYRKKLSKCINKIQKAEKIKQTFVQLAKREANNQVEPTSTSIQSFSKFVKFFYSLVQNKCPYCNSLAKTVKKQGANKIFIITSAKQNKEHERKKSKDSTSKGQTLHHTAELSHETKDNKKRTQKFITQKQIYKELRSLWTNQKRIVELIFGNSKTANSFSMFFLTCIFVPPSRFRPESKMGDDKYLHDHTSILSKILVINEDLKMMLIFERLGEIVEREGEKGKKSKLAELKGMKMQELKKADWMAAVFKKIKNKPEFINKWLQLQDSVNCFMDSTKSSKNSDKDFKGIRQILQKKEGLFRMKMMGKRVNYAARSVISPDPSLNTDEVGLPLFMAKKLTFAQHVNEYNLQRLQSYIINGKNYPGANFMEENGRMIKLEYLNDQQRLSHARNLLVNHENKIVYRHLIDGDNVMFNRQPTLHKPGLMAHRIKVLPKQSTLRMNYANCKSYNADFDGDEMNLHALQNYMAKAQAELCISDQMYNNPTNGKPLRQIMQDAIISSVYMTMKDTFYDKKDFSQLLYQSTFSLFEKKPRNIRINLVQPAILMPKELWTGKQLVTNVIKIVVEMSDLKFKNEKGLCMRSTTKISKGYMKGYEEEAQIIIQNNELLKGIIDKNQVGSGAEYGIIHSFNEIYGEKTTGKLITCLTKLFLSYIQVHGFTCGLDDLILKNKINKQRKTMIDEAHYGTVNELCSTFNCKEPQNVDFYGRSAYKCDEDGNFIDDRVGKRLHLKEKQEILHHIESKVVNEENALEELDREYKFHLNDRSSKIIDMCLKGFNKMFPANNFSMMTVTGAKGSNVNHSQVGVMLGQQELEGRRVPVMISGKTLPCFTAYDPNPRASGYISDRFLTGLREQEFYFHCMAGREGLIDTAVKTSRSGYLQRCLMKHLETLKVEYDYTVRDCDGSIVQFFYGEDSLDPAKQKFSQKLDFLKNNFSTIKKKYKHSEISDMIKFDQIKNFKDHANPKKITTIMEVFKPGQNLGSMSEKCYNSVRDCEKEFAEVYALKYMHDMIHPGESVGCTAAQSIGEPSTQMTLNTFHLAGHGGVNLTLGIPRLRQLLMTSTDRIKTPIMTLYFKDKIAKKQAEYYAKKFQKIKFSELVRDLDVQEWKQLYNDSEKLLSHNERKRYYKIWINYEPEEFIKKQFELTYEEINEKVEKSVVPMLLNHINRVKKKNQLRAQIKRVTASDRPQEQEQQREQKEDNQQNIEEDNKKQPQNRMIDENQQNEQQKKYFSKEFQKLTFNKSGAQIIVKVPLNLKKFLMTKVVEKILKSTILREIAGITSAIVLQEKNGTPFIQTAGVNFNVLTSLSFINELNVNKVGSNDIQAITKKYGIQAARNTLIQEIVTLFSAYGVTVDYRHLYLIGDYVTYGGHIKAMNRNWMSYSPSPFLRMSYETSVKFITGAALNCEVDNGKSPSSRIILGQNPFLGTGMCDVLMDTGL